jgi:uncharacterized protein YukJ
LIEGKKNEKSRGTEKNNLLFAFLGANFTHPLFRKLTGQFPYDVPTYTIYDEDDKRIGKKIKKLIEKNDKSFIVILRGNDAELDDVLFVPFFETD